MSSGGAFFSACLSYFEGGCVVGPKPEGLYDWGHWTELGCLSFVSALGLYAITQVECDTGLVPKSIHGLDKKNLQVLHSLLVHYNGTE